jgi:HlyD family secretion protein
VRWTATAPGKIEPRTGEFRISADVIGRITDIPVRVGDKVAAGDLVVRLDDDEAAARVAAAMADVAIKKFQRDDQGASARSKRRYDADDEVFAAEQKLHAARAELDRVAQRRADAGEELAKARTALQAADADLARLRAAAAEIYKEQGNPQPNQSEAALSAARSQVALAQALLEKTRIRSPIAGTIIQLSAKAGELASPSNVDPLVVVGDLTSLCVRAEVDGRDITRIKVGQRAIVRADAFRDVDFNGSVTSIAPSLAFGKLSPRGPRRPAEIEVLEVLVNLEDGSRLRAGMRVDVYFVGDDAAQP